MDERELHRALNGAAVPPPDEGAREQAIARSVAEFERAREEKTPQGFSLPQRLMDSFNKLIWRRPMNKRIVLGGLSTVFAAVLAVGIGLQWYTSPPPVPPVAPPVASVAPVMEQAMERTQAAAPGSVALEQTSLETRARAMQDATGELRALAQEALAYTRVPIGRDRFPAADANPVRVVGESPVSTFSVDVDTAAYAFVRSQLRRGVLPHKDAVRVEEMVNYFDYHYPLPENKQQPFRPTVSVLPSPWMPSNQLIHIGIKGFDIPAGKTPGANLVFLLDISGSMKSPDKLPLVKNSMKLLLGHLKPDDRVAIVVYAGAAGTVLEPTPARDKAKILAALEGLEAGGSTAGAEGIRLAYQLAEANFDKDAVNRVILATDGDFNVGITDMEELKGFIERKRATGVFLSVLGFGYGNLNDRLMQELAQNGNGVAAYIDTLNEARKVLVEEASSTLFPIARDVKIQMEFNPDVVAEYRLIGYETRALNREDFNNDAVDAGDIGAGHSVTALYEITPAQGGKPLIDASRYQPPASGGNAGFAGEYAFLKIRYKLPDEKASKLITAPVTTDDEFPPVVTEVEAADCSRAALPEDLEWRCRVRNAGWATAVAAFAQLLKGGQYTGGFDYDDVIQLAERHKGADKFGYRAEFIQLVRLAKSAAALEAQ